MTLAAARTELSRLLEVARHGDRRQLAAAAAEMWTWSGADWLRMDQVARQPYGPRPTVGAFRGRFGPRLSEPSGVRAALTSLHADGYVRQRATRDLASGRGRLRAAALAVRCVDHVPEVREEALRGLLRHVRVDEAEIVVAVLVAAAGRARASAPLDAYTETLLAVDDGAPIAALRSSAARAARRWAFHTSLTRNLMGVDAVVAAADTEADQLIRASCGRWLGSNAAPHQLADLLPSRHVELRLAAVRHVPEPLLAPERLTTLLLDPADRVRRAAQWRAAQRQVDPAPTYRSALTDARLKMTTAALAGLADVGLPADVSVVQPFTSAASSMVRAAAAAAVAALAPSPLAIELLQPMLMDPSPAVARAAASGLIRSGAPASVGDFAWEADEPASRRAAWRVQRSASSWSRVQADLRACADPDERLSELGATGIRNWLITSAASMWTPIGIDSDRLRVLIRNSGLPDDMRRSVAFYAGLDPAP